ncbi:MAG: DUF2164 domain-containing protein [Candidatus Magasanikiibacteriota bacterium]
MTEITHKWDLLPKEKKKNCLEEIITFFREERNEELGVIAAEDILDFFLENIGTDIYNKGVDDAKETVKKRFDDLELDLELLLNK